MNLAYFSGHHDHWKFLTPRSTTYVVKSGATRPLARPDCDGLRFAYTEEFSQPTPEAPRGIFYVVMVNDVLLDRPVQVVDGGRHLGFDDKGNPRWFGPKPTVVADGPALQLLEDAISANPLKRKALEPLRSVLRSPGPPQDASPHAFPAGLETLVEKAATDAGFDARLSSEGGWLAFSSTHAPLRIWVGGAGGEALRLAMSMAPVAELLVAEGGQDAGAEGLPAGATRSILAAGVQPLYALLRRAFALSRSLPDTPLQRFKVCTAGLPRTTEAERLVVQRVGQDFFRQSLLDYWGGRCAVTGLAVPELLRASHIKPWADCERDEERLDVFNGLLLAPNLDALFDGGWVTVLEDGALRYSSRIEAKALALLGLHGGERVEGLKGRHLEYMAWHRGKVFDVS